MARMKDIKDKFNNLKDKFKPDKSDDLSLRLSYDTHEAVNNITVTKEFCAEMRKIGSHGIVTYSIEDDDKKKSKKTLNALSSLFIDTGKLFPDTDPIRGPLLHSGTVLAEINRITKEYEGNVEQQVIKPLAEIEKSCNEIQDQRKKLHDLKRDIASLKDKLERMVDQSNSDDQKIHALRDQIDDVEMEFENASDVYVQKVLQFEASSFEHAHAIHGLVICRKDYHEKCSKELLKIIPETNQYMEEKRIPSSFRYPLENHLKEIKRAIAYPIEKCVTALSNVEYLRQEGLFRVSGGQSKSNLLCSVLNIMKFDQMATYTWPAHVLADALKRYLREMPVPLLGKVTTTEWDSCYEKSRSGNKQEAFWQIKDILNKMPKSYYNNIEYLIRFLNKVVQEKSYNKMNIQNICTVFTPNLFRQSGDASGNVGINMDISTSCTFVLEALLTDTNFFFSHSNQQETLLIPEINKVPSLILNNVDMRANKKQILYRTYSDQSPELSQDRPSMEIKLKRRQRQCVDSNIFPPVESDHFRRSNSTSVPKENSEFRSLDFFVPKPPRRPKNN